MRKRQWKKILSMVLALAMVFSMNTSVFAAEVTAPAVETEAPAAEPAPAEIEAPAAEPAPEAETPAPAEEPAAETPAAEEPATAETPAAEEPAAEEKPAAEAPAEKTAAEAEVPEVVEEAEPAAEGVGPDGIDWENTGSTVNGITVSCVNASGVGTGNVAKIAQPDAEKKEYVVSVDGVVADNSNLSIVIKGDSPISIDKISLSADDIANYDSTKIKEVILSADKIAYNDASLYFYDTKGKVENTSQMVNITSAKGVVFEAANGAITAVGSGSNSKASGAWDMKDGYIYKDVDPKVKITVSNDKWTASFDQVAVEEVIDATAAPVLLYEGAAVTAGNDVKLDVTKLGTTIASGKIFVAYKKGDVEMLASVDGGIDAAATAADGAQKSATTTIVSANVTATDYKVVDAAWLEKEGRDLIDAAGAETGWEKVKEGKISVNGLAANSKAYVLLKNTAASSLTTYKVIELQTKAEVQKDWVSQNGIWDVTGVTGAEVWVDSATAPTRLLVSGNVTGTENIVLTAKSGKATGVAQVVISGDKIGSVTLKASDNKIGTEIKNAAVYSESGNQIGEIVADATGVVVKEGKLSWNGTSKTTEIPDGATVFKATDVSTTPTGYVTLSYDAVAMKLSENATAVYTYGEENKGMLETPQVFTKDTDGDIYDFAEDKAYVFLEVEGTEYVKTKYAFVDFSGASFDYPTTLSAVSDYKHDYFVAPGLASDTDYAVSTVSGDTSKFYDGLDFFINKKSGDFKVLSSDKAGTKLEQGQTYYIYGFKRWTTGTKFSGYGEVGKVTLGISENFTIEPNTKGQGFLVNDDIDGTLVSWDAVPATIKIAGKDLKVTRELIEEYANVDDTTYTVSFNEDFSPKATLTRGSATPKVKLTKKGVNYLSIDGIEDGHNYAKDSTHDTITLTVKNGQFPVGDKDSALEVTLGKYYYGLDFETFLKDATAKMEGVEFKASTLKAEYGKKVASDGKSVSEPFAEAKAEETVKTLSAGSTFAVRFYLTDKGQAPSSNAATISVNKMPVDLAVEQNFFSKQGELADATKAVDGKLLVVKDLYGTEYEARTKKFDDYFTGDVKPDFTDVVYAKDGDLDVIKLPQNFGLKYTLKTELSKNAANYDFTAGNAEGYGYRVAPVYTVNFSGSYVQATGKVVDKDNKTEIADYKVEAKSAGAITISSAAAVKLASFDTLKPLKNADFDINAYFRVPLKKDVEANGNFMSWKKDNIALKDGEFQTLSTNGITYKADVRELVPGFTNVDNALMISMGTEFTFTGNKLVTDYREQAADSECATRPGVGAAIEKTRQNALKNSGVIDLGVFVGKNRLVENYDYTVAYKNNINAYIVPMNGSEVAIDQVDAKKAPQLTITFKNGYAQYPAVTKYFSINPAHLEDITEGTGVDSRIIKVNKNVTDKDKIFKKTDLININTGKALKWNKVSSKSDVIFDIEQSAINNTEGAQTVTIKGAAEGIDSVGALPNYDGEITTTVYFIDGKITTKTVNIKAGKVDGTNSEIDYANEDFVKANYVDSIKEDIKTNILNAGKNAPAAGSEIEVDLLRVKANYRVPGKKKINYKAIAIPAEGAPVAYKGAFNYTIKAINTTQLETIKESVAWEGGEHNVNDGKTHVPYVKAGATLAPSADFNKVDCLELFKVTFKNNKKADADATASLTAIASYFDKDAKKAIKDDKTKFNVTFHVDKADLANANIRTAYYINGKTEEKDLKKLGGIVLTDDMGDVIKYPNDYTVNIASDEATASAKTKIYKEGSKITLSSAGLATAYLGAATIKINKKASGWSAKGIDPADIDKLTSGTSESQNATLNKEFADKYGLEVYVGKDKLAQKNDAISGNNFNFVVTKNAKGTQCTIQVVGCGTRGKADCGAYGGDDVLAKKAVKAAMKK